MCHSSLIPVLDNKCYGEKSGIEVGSAEHGTKGFFSQKVG